MAPLPPASAPAPESPGMIGNLVMGFFGLLWNIISGIWYWATFLVLALLAIPSMWVMAYLYPIWEGWLKDNGDWRDKQWERLLLFIPFSILIAVALVFYHLFHKPFEAMVKEKFGLKLF